MPIIPQTYDFNAGDTVALTFSPSGDLPSFTGYATTLTITGPDGRITRSAGACTVAGDGSTATYTAVASDFPTPGEYSALLRVAQGGRAFTCDQVIFSVGPGAAA